MEPCLECGFEPGAIALEETPSLIRRLAWLHCKWLLASAADEAGRAALRTRPRDGMWSPLEYAAHVRDVYALFERRIQTILRTPGREVEIVDHDAAVARGGYDRLVPEELIGEICACAGLLAETLALVTPPQWSLQGLRGGESRTIADIARRAVHEGRHHLMDMQGMLASGTRAAVGP